jgi:hypothetical protein
MPANKKVQNIENKAVNYIQALKETGKFPQT